MSEAFPTIVSSLNLVDVETPPPSLSENEVITELVGTMHKKEDRREECCVVIVLINRFNPIS